MFHHHFVLYNRSAVIPEVEVCVWGDVNTLFITTRGGGGELCSIPSFPKRVYLVLCIMGRGLPLYGLFVLSVCPHLFLRRRHATATSHNTTEEEDRAEEEQHFSSPGRVGCRRGGGGRSRRMRKEEKK